MGNYFTKTTTTVEKPKYVAKNLYGWMPDPIDLRDLHYHHNHEVPTTDQDLPQQIDLRDECPHIYDQGKLGSCTANAIAGAYQFDEMKQDNKDLFVPARLFIYYNERMVEGSVSTDSGATLRDGMKVINEFGTCHEKYWPYIIEKFTEKPNEKSYNDAKLHRGLKYERIRQDLTHMKHCLASGYPFVFGFAVFESFESQKVAETGIMPIPQPGEEPLGGHAVMAVGYDDDKEWFVIRNSWSEKWGDKGYFYMPYDFILNHKMANDFWCLQKVERDESESENNEEAKQEK